MSDLRLLLDVISGKVTDTSTKLLNSDGIAIGCLVFIWVMVGFMLAITLF